jgi:ABC-type multidrug transport system ATPase subunit
MSRLHGTKFKVEMVLRLLGLSHARDTIIGNTMMRGVSGGERKRVTSGEMMVGNTRVMAMDEISTGLDSATLYTIITYLKQAAAGFKTTMVISLLQPPPEVMHLFDDVMLLSEG